MPAGRPSESLSLSQIACVRAASVPGPAAAFFLAGVRTLTPGTRFPFAGENMCVRISGKGAMGEESGSSGRADRVRGCSCLAVPRGGGGVAPTL